ncbi:MAG: GldG family protein [Kiritimatiellia bacterium]
MAIEHKQRRGAGWRDAWVGRLRRWLTGLNTFVALLFAFLLVLLINSLAQRYYLRFDLTRRGYYQLSDKSRALLTSLAGELTVVGFLRESESVTHDIRNLLKEYEYIARQNPSLHMSVEVVDPDRELGRARELSVRYDVREAGVVVFEWRNRRKFVEIRDILDYEYSLTSTGIRKRMVGFRAEQAFSSAIHNVVQSATPIVYFLWGHGERDPQDFSNQDGYARLVQTVRRDNVEVRTLLLAEKGGVPPDCSALIIAGPDRPFTKAEIDALEEYLTHGGRVLLLLDVGRTVGLEPLLLRWGVRLQRDVVVDPARTLTGREIFLTEYGDHAITRRLGKVATVFYLARSVERNESGDGTDTTPDRPRVTSLALTSAEGWADQDLNERPFVFDPNRDRRGPITVAVAVEKGEAGAEVHLKATRLVVVGDSSFVSNAILKSGGAGNIAFFMNALNWLLEREILLTIPPRSPQELRLDMTRRQIYLALLSMAGAGPVLLGLIGTLVAWRRRR